MKSKILKKILIIIILAGFGKPIFAQQNAMFSQYMFNSLAINPAYAGSRNVVSATALYRNQWVGIEGAPKTGTFSIDAPISGDRLGMGLQVISDKIGIATTSGLVLSTAYRIPMNEGSLSFGLQGSMNNYHAGFGSVNLDQTGPIPDRAFQGDVNKTLYNFGSGVYFNTNRLYAGFSIQDFVSNRLSIDTISDGDVTARQSAHGYLTAGYVFPISMDLNLKTSALIKGVMGAPLQGDINVTLWIKDVIAIGTEYRTNADISALMEIKVSPQFRIGYAYDKSITPLRKFNSGSHEFMLRYEFSFDRDRTLSPRYF